MKKIKNLTYVLGVLFLGSVITACDKFEDDVPPARMSNLILNDDHFTTTVNTGLQMNVLANDTIGGTATLQFGQPQHGTIQTSNNGSVMYQPAPNYTGPDSFTYQACLDANCATALVNIDVLSGGPNDTTVVCKTKAVDDILTLFQNSVDTIRVMSNDNLCGISGTTLNISQQPAHGQASITSNNLVMYTPAHNYTGQDELTYTISNANGTSSAKLLITVNPIPQTCIIKANPDSAFFVRNQGAMDTVSVAVVANDVTCPNDGPVNVQLVHGTTTQYGTLMIAYNGQVPRIIYTTKPSTGRNLTDTFQYRICQGNKCSVATVSIYIQ